MNRELNIITRSVVCILVIGGSMLLAKVIMGTKKEPKQRPQHHAQVAVDVMPAQRQNFRVIIRSRGTVQARTRSTLASEVSGRIVEIANAFIDGGYFAAGDILARVDQRDYETALAIAKADLQTAKLKLTQEESAEKDATTAVTLAKSALIQAQLEIAETRAAAHNLPNAVVAAKSALAQAHLTLAEEQAQSAQAKRDWERLGNNSAPGPLVLRTPQLTAARADVAAAESALDQRKVELDLAKPMIAAAEATVDARLAELEQRRRDVELSASKIAAARAEITAEEARLAQRQLDLERTAIVAPYTGRLLTKHVDVGDYLNPGTLMADIYATAILEVRLPISDRDLAFIRLPGNSAAAPTNATLLAKVGGVPTQVRATINRTEGAIDSESRQLVAIAQIEIDSDSETAAPALRVGQYVEAEIEGHMLEDVFVLPRMAVRQGNKVLAVDTEYMLHRKTVHSVYSNTKSVVITEGLDTDDLVCLTPVTFAGASIKVKPSVDGTPLPPLPGEERPGPADKKRGPR